MQSIGPMIRPQINSRHSFRGRIDVMVDIYTLCIVDLLLPIITGNVEGVSFSNTTAQVSVTAHVCSHNESVQMTDCQKELVAIAQVVDIGIVHALILDSIVVL